MKCFLGIDAGTSGIKAIVMNESGDICGNGYREYDVYSPRPGWFEQNPEKWWNACVDAIGEAVREYGNGKDIVGIGFSGQMQGCVLLDKEGRPLNNCLIWMDQRSIKECEEINSSMAESEMLSEAGMQCLPSFWAPKLLWIKKHHPDIYEKIYKVIFPKDYLRYKMTGEIASEVSDASCSFLIDIKNRKWSDKLLSTTGISRDILVDKLLESQEIAGRLTKNIADTWGMCEGIPVIAGGGDQTAGGVGSGVIEAGSIAATIGTSGVVFGCSDNPFIDSKKQAIYSLCHSVPNKYAFLGCTLGAGSSFKWVRDTFFVKEKNELAKQGIDIYDYMTKLAAENQAGCEGLIFLPYLNGESTPHVDPNARGTFFGLSARHDIGAICRSVMEGVTYSLRDSIEILRDTGISIDKVNVMGGGAKSALWRQIQANIYNAQVVRMNMEEGPAAGAALLAAVGAGVFKDLKEACDAVLKVKDITEPVQKDVEIYDEFYQCYRSLYSLLKEEFTVQAMRVEKIMNKN